MPYKSDAQRKFFNANRDEMEAQGVDVDEWNKSSKGKKLPEKVKKAMAFAAKLAAAGPTTMANPTSSSVGSHTYATKPTTPDYDAAGPDGAYGTANMRMEQYRPPKPQPSTGVWKMGPQSPTQPQHVSRTGGPMAPIPGGLSPEAMRDKMVEVGYGSPDDIQLYQDGKRVPYNPAGPEYAEREAAPPTPAPPSKPVHPILGTRWPAAKPTPAPAPQAPQPASPTSGTANMTMHKAPQPQQAPGKPVVIGKHNRTNPAPAGAKPWDPLPATQAAAPAAKPALQSWQTQAGRGGGETMQQAQTLKKPPAPISPTIQKAAPKPMQGGAAGAGVAMLGKAGAWAAKLAAGPTHPEHGRPIGSYEESGNSGHQDYIGPGRNTVVTDVSGNGFLRNSFLDIARPRPGKAPGVYKVKHFNFSDQARKLVPHVDKEYPSTSSVGSHTHATKPKPTMANPTTSSVGSHSYATKPKPAKPPAPAPALGKAGAHGAGPAMMQATGGGGPAPLPKLDMTGFTPDTSIATEVDFQGPGPQILKKPVAPAPIQLGKAGNSQAPSTPQVPSQAIPTTGPPNVAYPQGTMTAPELKYSRKQTAMPAAQPDPNQPSTQQGAPTIPVLSKGALARLICGEPKATELMDDLSAFSHFSGLKRALDEIAGVEPGGLLPAKVAAFTSVLEQIKAGSEDGYVEDWHQVLMDIVKRATIAPGPQPNVAPGAPAVQLPDLANAELGMKTFQTPNPTIQPTLVTPAGPAGAGGGAAPGTGLPTGQGVIENNGLGGAIGGPSGTGAGGGMGGSAKTALTANDCNVNVIIFGEPGEPNNGGGAFDTPFDVAKWANHLLAEKPIPTQKTETATNAKPKKAPGSRALGSLAALVAA